MTSDALLRDIRNVLDRHGVVAPTHQVREALPAFLAALAPVAPVIPPTHPYAGSNSARQSVGDPGHCERCARYGHVAAHRNLGCGDVGCTRGHSPRVQNKNGTTKHTCTPHGGALPFGKKADPGECCRCDELRAGDAPRADHAGGRRRADHQGYPTDAERARHRETCVPCSTGSGVCTAGEW